MGYYIPGPPLGKAEFLKAQFQAEPITCPKSFSEVPAGKALICVVHNGPFEAAGHAFSAEEFEHFVYDGTSRKKEWFLMDLKLTDKLTRGGDLDV